MLLLLYHLILKGTFQSAMVSSLTSLPVPYFTCQLGLLFTPRVITLPFAKKEGSENIAGGYDGLSPEILLKNLDNPGEFDIDENGKVSILECECGCDGCWPMKIKVLDLESKIIWTEIEQPHRTFDSHNFWDYANFEKFSFYKTTYNEQLEKLRQTTNNSTK